MKVGNGDRIWRCMCTMDLCFFFSLSFSFSFQFCVIIKSHKILGGRRTNNNLFLVVCVARDIYINIYIYIGYCIFQLLLVINRRRGGGGGGGV